MTSPLAQFLHDHAGPHRERRFCRHWCAHHADRLRLSYVRRFSDPLVRYRPLDVLAPMSHPLAPWQRALPNCGEPLGMIVTWFADICVWHADDASEADEIDDVGRSRQQTS